MDRIVEVLFHFLVWLGRAVGLLKRPLPVPPDVSKPITEPTVSEPGGGVRFYGPFIPQWGSFDYREVVTLDMRYQVHGCGPAARKYGIKDILTEGILCLIRATNLETEEEDSIFDSGGNDVSGFYAIGEQFYWDPGWVYAVPRYPYTTLKLKPACRVWADVELQPVVRGGVRYELSIQVMHPNGQRWTWSEEVTVSWPTCDQRGKKEG